MSIKNEIRKSWKHPELPEEFSKKGELDFRPKKQYRISLPVYILSMSSLILIFSLVLIFSKITFSKSNENRPQEKIEFGSLDPMDLNIKTHEVSKVYIKNQSYYNVRGNFTLWFNNLKFEKASIDYSKINITEYIANIDPVVICVQNEEYDMYFTDKDYLVVCYEQKYIMYDLEKADVLLKIFVSNF